VEINMSRGYDPSNAKPVEITVPQLKPTTPTPSGPSVEQSPTKTKPGRGTSEPTARPDNTTGQPGSKPTGIVVEESPAQVRGRGADQPIV